MWEQATAQAAAEQLLTAQASGSDDAAVPKFAVRLRCDDAVATGELLDKAGIPKIGPVFAGYTESPKSWTVGPGLTPVLEADNAETAGRRILDIVGDGAEIERVEPY